LGVCRGTDRRPCRSERAATILVWAPVLAYLVFGDWATEQLDTGLRWLAHHSRSATVSALVIVGLALIVDVVLTLA
jgi:hypothetical protein